MHHNHSFSLSVQSLPVAFLSYQACFALVMQFFLPEGFVARQMNVCVRCRLPIPRTWVQTTLPAFSIGQHSLAFWTCTFTKVNILFYCCFFLLQGCPSPIVVKFADTEKEKLQKKMQQMVALGGMGMNIGLGMGFPYFQHANYNAACQQVREKQ